MSRIEPDLQGAMQAAARAVEAAITRLLPSSDLPEARVFDAMRHGCLAGGKRLRPFLVLESAKLFGVNPDCAMRVATAIEFIHCYSLIHDDLPAMDNADLRRGRPTVHKVYDDATAILAGDGLLTLAFEVLADHETHEDAQVRCRLVTALAKAAGAQGMVGGQMLDLIAEHTEFDIGGITRLQRLKTGELIAFAATAGALLGRASPHQYQALHNYAHDLGLAFQIADDLLDVQGTEAQTGKSVGRDEQAGKATFVSIMGVDRARDQAHRLAAQAAGHLDQFGERAALLQAVATFVVERQS